MRIIRQCIERQRRSSANAYPIERRDPNRQELLQREAGLLPETAAPSKEEAAD